MEDIIEKRINKEGGCNEAFSAATGPVIPPLLPLNIRFTSL